ncbi:MAG TPA: hypothetical protein ENJ18_18450 [Nannocystis exedens]|nr:hypothetical protein [Nannocystis exedens]
MSTWILFFHLLMPSTEPQTSGLLGASVDLEMGLRHRGVERLFAKFDRQASADKRARQMRRSD